MGTAVFYRSSYNYLLTCYLEYGYHAGIVNCVFKNVRFIDLSFLINIMMTDYAVHIN